MTISFPILIRFRFFRLLFKGVVQGRTLYHALYDRTYRVGVLKVLVSVVFFRCVGRFQRDQNGGCSFFILCSLSSLVRRLLGSHYRIVSNLSLQRFIRVRGRHSGQDLAIYNRGHSRLVLSRLRAAISLFSCARLYCFVSFLLVRVRPSLFGLYPSLCPRFFATRLCRQYRVKR